MSDRIKWLRNFLCFSQKEMADILRIKQNAYSNIETGKVSLTDRNKDALSLALGVDRSWFDREQGALNFITESPLSKMVSNNAGVLVCGDYDPEAIKEAALKTINSYKNKNIIAEAAPQITSLKPSNTRPRIPYTAAAGSLTSAVEGITDADCEQIPVITAFPSYDYTIIVKGDSMYPNLEGGDEVACKRIDSTSFIQWGKVHVLDTAQGIVIKRVYDDGGNVKCVSYNKEYPDFTINKEEVYSMSLVVGMLRL